MSIPGYKTPLCECLYQIKESISATRKVLNDPETDPNTICSWLPDLLEGLEILITISKECHYKAPDREMEIKGIYAIKKIVQGCFEFLTATVNHKLVWFSLSLSHSLGHLESCIQHLQSYLEKDAKTNQNIASSPNSPPIPERS